MLQRIWNEGILQCLFDGCVLLQKILGMFWCGCFHPANVCKMFKLLIAFTKTLFPTYKLWILITWFDVRIIAAIYQCNDHIKIQFQPWCVKYNSNYIHNTACQCWLSCTCTTHIQPWYVSRVHRTRAINVIACAALERHYFHY